MVQSPMTHPLIIIICFFQTTSANVTLRALTASEICEGLRDIFVKNTQHIAHRTNWGLCYNITMFFTLDEIVKWFGMTVFEIFMYLISCLIFTVLCVLKYEDIIVSWWHVFIPLFTGAGLNAYFCVIVFIRMYKKKDYRTAGLRLIYSLVSLMCLFVFELLFCLKLESSRRLSYSEIFAPIFVLLQLMMARACRVS